MLLRLSAKMRDWAESTNRLAIHLSRPIAIARSMKIHSRKKELSYHFLASVHEVIRQIFEPAEDILLCVQNTNAPSQIEVDAQGRQRNMHQEADRKLNANDFL